jgi:hypothetical protein
MLSDKHAGDFNFTTANGQSRQMAHAAGIETRPSAARAVLPANYQWTVFLSSPLPCPISPNSLTPFTI